MKTIMFVGFPTLILILTSILYYIAFTGIWAETESRIKRIWYVSQATVLYIAVNAFMFMVFLAIMELDRSFTR